MRPPRFVSHGQAVGDDVWLLWARGAGSTDTLITIHGPDGTLQIMYGIDGRKELTEETLDHLDGYMGSKPVRIGELRNVLRRWESGPEAVPRG